MLHRLTLRLLFGPVLDADLPARRRKMRIILLLGVAVYPPFFAIAYALYRDTQPLTTVGIGLVAALTCVPVCLYAYAAGFGSPLRTLWQADRETLCWLALKIGFLYPFLLYWMILGMVEFFFGYHAFRAAMVSFVASAVARDGFEIGYLAARPDLTGLPGRRARRVFPDGRRLSDIFGKEVKRAAITLVTATTIGAVAGGLLAMAHPRPAVQAFAIGLISAAVATPVYRRLAAVPSASRYFLWPAMTMGCSYFFIFAYLLRVVAGQRATWDLAPLAAACCAWTVFDALAIGLIQQQKMSAPLEPSPRADSIESSARFVQTGAKAGRSGSV